MSTNQIRTSSESLTVTALDLNAINRVMIVIDRRLQKLEADLKAAVKRIEVLEAS